MRAAWRVYQDLKHMKANNYKYANLALPEQDTPEDVTDPVWMNIRTRILEFVVFPPKTFHDPLKTPTRQGLVDKIRKLFDGYTLGQEPDDVYLQKVSTGKFRSVDLHHGAQDLMNLQTLPLTGL